MRKKGFTLVELLVVMGILVILSTVGLASFRSSQIKGRDTKRKNDLSQIQRGLELYCNDRGRYPLSSVDGEIIGCGLDPDSPEICSWDSPWELGFGDEKTVYLKALPVDPQQPYCYLSTTGVSYQLYAKLENEKDSGCLQTGCPLVRNCGGYDYNYGVSSGDLNP
jgi:prepilin-type N-terminal cleavage/methylation domain-containing protein